MEQRIRFIVQGEEYSIPNTWEQLTPYVYQKLVEDIGQMAAGRLSAGMVRVRFVCHCMGWKLNRFTSREALENLAWIAEQVTFPFVIQYPDDDAVLQDLDTHTRSLCRRIPPERLKGVAIARYLQRLPYRYAVDACFCAQLVPVIEHQGRLYTAYKIDTSFRQLTCSLTALQFIEARRVADSHPDLLPLLAAILYYPAPYNSEGAQQLALELATLPAEVLQAVSLNFHAFVNYLFTRTEFSLLTAGSAQSSSAITTGALESLYNLSADGLGNIREVEQMNLLPYLTILRKKLIESVRSLHSAGMKPVEIEQETGLPLGIVKQIIN